MPLTTMDEYRCKLVSKVLLGSSQEEVKRFIDAAIKALAKHGVNGHIIARFVARTITELENFNPMNKDSSQWSNIQTARIHLNRIRNAMSEKAA